LRSSRNYKTQFLSIDDREKSILIGSNQKLFNIYNKLGYQLKSKWQIDNDGFVTPVTVNPTKQPALLKIPTPHVPIIGTYVNNKIVQVQPDILPESSTALVASQMRLHT
jgi:hypothetical protein